MLIQLRNDTAANFTASNPVLAAGEVGIEWDTGKQKNGDGTTAWNSLPYAGGSGGGTVTGVSVVTANGYSGTVANPSTTPEITITGPAALPPTGSAGGDLTGSTYPNPVVAAGAITTGKMANLPASSLLGNPAGSQAAPEPITLGTGLSFAGSVLNSTATGTGTVTSVAVSSANGFGGSVANPNTSPSIQISTSVDGILIGNGTAVAAAVPGSDYVTPSSLTAAQIVSIVGTIFPATAPPTPMTFTGTLPNATAGTPWTGQMQLGGTYVQPVEISAATGTIPAWMGSAVINYSAGTVTWNGTPATSDEGTDTFTPQATDSTTPSPQVVNGPTQSVVVSGSPPPSSSPVQQSYTELGNVASGTVPFTQTATAGNLLLVAVQCNTAINTPAGWSLLPGAAYNAVGVAVYSITASGTETSFPVVTTSGTATGKISAVMQEWAGQLAGTSASGFANQTTGALSSGPTSAAPSASAIPVIFSAANSTAVGNFSFTAPFTGIPTSITPSPSIYPITVAWAPAPNAAVTLTGTMTTPGGATVSAQVRWQSVWVQPS